MPLSEKVSGAAWRVHLVGIGGNTASNFAYKITDRDKFISGPWEKYGSLFVFLELALYYILCPNFMAPEINPLKEFI
jgi:hypothetical protein